MLFVTTGDGTAGSDGRQTGQRIDDLQASVLRIDVDHPEGGRNYGVPKDNPFVGRSVHRPEVWAYGLRNPWRLSYDRRSGQLWVGNNGQDAWEQVYLIQKGGNYGWSLFEGSHIFLEKRQAGPDPILLPAADHPHSEARSLTGGRVYRGARLPELDGVYVYGDWLTGRVWGVRHDGKQTTWHRELVDTPFNITGFGTDHAGELYIIDQTSGGFYRLEPTSEADRPKQPFPTRLSETGLFASVSAHAPHPAAIPFEVVAPQWADGASMTRFAALPGLDRVVQKPQLNAGGAWTLPNGSVLVQTLSLDRLDDAGKPAQADRDPPASPSAGGMDGVLVPMERRAERCRAGPGRRRRRGVRGARPVRAGGPSRPDLAVPRPDRVPDVSLARRGIHPGLHPAPARPRPRSRRDRGESAPRDGAHRRVRRRAAGARKGQAPAGQPLRLRGRHWRPGSSRTCT